MSIFISKSAINHNPLNSITIDSENQIYPKLISFLKDVNYLSELIKGEQSGVKNLMQGNNEGTYIAVVRLKIALNIIDDYIEDDDFNIPEGVFNTNVINAGVYDIKMENAVSVFQNFASIPMTGVIDDETLSKIDFYLNPKIIVDFLNNSIVGKPEDTNILIKTNLTDGVFTYRMKINDNKTFIYTSEVPLSVIPILNKQDDKFRIIADNSIKDKLTNSQELEDLDKQLIFDGQFITFENIEIIKIDNSNTDTINKPNIQNELNLTPPRIFSDEHAELYLVKNGDNISEIIQNKYYGEELNIINPYFGGDDSTGEEVIFTFPERSLSNDFDTRPDDARYQFYLNLIYYYNTPEKENGEFIEYGIEKVDGYQRFDDNHLNSFDMFDNKFEDSDNSSALPNYYRFLKQQEQFGTQIQFDENGEPLSFNMVQDKYIWIPSRLFAESLYYHLNFRHFEMLQDQSGDSMIYSILSAPLIVGVNLLRSLGTITEFLKDEVIELYNEALDFFKKVYNYAITVLTKVIPRGMGGRLGGSIGVTWGYPIATDIKASKTIWRKMSKENELIFVLREEYEAFIGADTGVGGSIGFKFGSGKKKKTVGLQLGAGIQAGIRPNLNFEYQFPIRPEETGLLTMLISAFGGVVTKAGSAMLSALNVINLDPQQYLTWMKFGFPVETRFWGNAQAGFDTSNGNVKKEKHVTRPSNNIPTIPETQDKSFWNLENIWNKLPGIGIAADGHFALGLEIEYKAKYKKNPLVPEVSGRVPSEVEIQNLFFVQGSLQTSAMGNLLERFLMNLSGVSLFLEILNFDQGIAIGLNNKFIREGAAIDMELQDADYSSATSDNTIVTDSSTGKFQFGGDKGKWQSQIVLSRYSGDVDGLFINGSENMIKLDTYKIYEVLKTDNGADFFSFQTVSNILSIIYSVEFQYKKGLGTSKNRRKAFTDNVFDNLNKGLKSGVKRDFLTNAKDKAFQYYLGAYVKIEFKTENLNTIFKYFIKRWYLMFKYSDSLPTTWKKFKNNVENEIEDFNTEKGELNEVINNVEYHTELYERLNTFINQYVDILNPEFVVDDTGFDFKGALNEFLDASKLFLSYLVNPSALLTPIKLSDDSISWKDMQLGEFLKAVSTVTQIIDASVAIEGMLGFSIGGNVSGALGAKVRLSLMGEVALMDRTLFMEDGEFLNLEANDPFKSAFDQIKKITNTDVSNTRVNGIRNSILNLI